jgi:DnaK suppressor protein
VEESKARELLLKERSEVAGLLEGAQSAAEADLRHDDGPGDFGDAGQELEAQAGDAQVADRLQERLDAIDRALGRIEAGSYGKSTLSGQPIPDERLQADPAAELTIEEASSSRGQ